MGKATPQAQRIIEEGQQGIFGHIESHSAAGHFSLPCYMLVSVKEFPYCCGIRILADFVLKINNEFVRVTHGGQNRMPIDLLTGKFVKEGLVENYGNLSLNNWPTIIAGISPEEKLKVCEHMFDVIAQRVDKHRIHQWMIADQINRNRADLSMTRHFVNYLKKNKIGKVINGAITVNGNYTNKEPTFIQSWTWIPPSKYTFQVKGGRIYGPCMSRLIHLCIDTVLDGVYKYKVKEINFLQAMKAAEFSVREWKEKSLKVDNNLINRWRDKK